MTVAVLRPDTTISTADITVSGAASASAATSDNSDTSFAVGPRGAQVVVELGTTALPPGAVTRSITPRCRARALTVASQVSLAVLQPATTERTDSGSFFRDASQVAFATLPVSTTIGNLAASSTAFSATQAALNALTLEVLVTGPDSVRVYELYVDVDVVEQPTTIVTAPTGVVTDSTTVTLEFQHVPGDGGGPTAFYQARVFTAAQLAVTGFDPASSPATLDTGVLLGSARALKVGPLPNDTTFKAYVRTAQNVNGQPHWAAWDTAFTSFSIDTPAPTVLSVVAVGQNAEARVRLTVTRDSAGEPWDLLEVERTDDAGVSWVPVRGATLVDPPGNVWIGYDGEAGNGVTARYRARGVAVVGLQQLTGAWTLSQTTVWSSRDIWLKDLTYPANSRKVKLFKRPEPSRPIVQGFHKVLGASRKIGITDVRDGEEGDFGIQTSTFAEAIALEQLLDGRPLLLQMPAAWDMNPSRYLMPGSYQRGNLTPKVFGAASNKHRYTIPYVEVARPVDNGVFIPGLTWEDLGDQALSWADMLAAGTTWGDLL